MKNLKNIALSSFILITLSSSMYSSQKYTPTADEFKQNLISYFFNAINDGNVTCIKNAIRSDVNINSKNVNGDSAWEMVQHHITYENWPYTETNGKKTDVALKIIQALEEANIDKTVKKPRWLIEEAPQASEIKSSTPLIDDLLKFKEQIANRPKTKSEES